MGRSSRPVSVISSPGRVRNSSRGGTPESGHNHSSAIDKRDFSDGADSEFSDYSDTLGSSEGDDDASDDHARPPTPVGAAARRVAESLAEHLPCTGDVPSPVSRWASLLADASVATFGTDGAERWLGECVPRLAALSNPREPLLCSRLLSAVGGDEADAYVVRSGPQGPRVSRAIKSASRAGPLARQLLLGSAFGTGSMRRSIALDNARMPEAARKLRGLLGERGDAVPEAAVLAVRGMYNGKDTGVVLYRLGSTFRPPEVLLAELIMERVETVGRDTMRQAASRPPTGSLSQSRALKGHPPPQGQSPPTGRSALTGAAAAAAAPCRSGGSASRARPRGSSSGGNNGNGGGGETGAASVLSGLDNVSGVVGGGYGDSIGSNDRWPARSNSNANSNANSNTNSAPDPAGDAGRGGHGQSKQRPMISIPSHERLIDEASPRGAGKMASAASGATSATGAMDVSTQGSSSVVDLSSVIAEEEAERARLLEAARLWNPDATPFPADERARAAELLSYRVVDGEEDEAFDRITSTCQRVFGTPIALVSLIDSDRQWFLSHAGLGAKETPRCQAFCAWAIVESRGSVFEVRDSHADPRFAGNPLVVGPPHVRFYAGSPIMSPNNHALGTLCIIDDAKPRPEGLTDVEKAVLLDLSRIVMQTIMFTARNRAMSLAINSSALEVGNLARQREMYLKALDSIDEAIIILAPARLPHSNGQRSVPASAASLTSTSVEDIARFRSSASQRGGGDAAKDKGSPVNDDNDNDNNNAGGSEAAAPAPVDNAEVDRVVAEVINSLAIVHCNQGFEATTGFAREGSLGCTLDLLFGQDPTIVGAARREIANVFLSGSAGRVRVLLDRSDGTRFWCNVSLSVVNWKGRGGEEELSSTAFSSSGDGGSASGGARAGGSSSNESDIQFWAAVLYDVSGDMERAQTLEEARDLAESEVHSKDIFLRTVSHELRTPLNSVYTAVRMLADSEPPLSDEQIELVSLMEGGAETLKSLICNLLDYASIGANKVVVRPSPVRVWDLVDAAVSIVSPLANKKGLAMKSAVDPAVPSVIEADLKLIRQVLTNILGNAVKFTDTGSLTLRVSTIGRDELPAAYGECQSHLVPMMHNNNNSNNIVNINSTTNNSGKGSGGSGRTSGVGEGDDDGDGDGDGDGEGDEDGDAGGTARVGAALRAHRGRPESSSFALTASSNGSSKATGSSWHSAVSASRRATRAVTTVGPTRSLSRQSSLGADVWPGSGGPFAATAVAGRDRSHLLFECIDTGRGIPPSVVSTVFDPFVRADEAHAVEGTGLGLAIAKSIVESLEGTIGIDSKLGEGTRMWFKVPIAECQASAIAELSTGLTSPGRAVIVRGDAGSAEVNRCISLVASIPLQLVIVENLDALPAHARKLPSRTASGSDEADPVAAASNVDVIAITVDPRGGYGIANLRWFAHGVPAAVPQVSVAPNCTLSSFVSSIARGVASGSLAASVGEGASVQRSSSRLGLPPISPSTRRRNMGNPGAGGGGGGVGGASALLASPTQEQTQPSSSLHTPPPAPVEQGGARQSRRASPLVFAKEGDGPADPVVTLDDKQGNGGGDGDGKGERGVDPSTAAALIDPTQSSIKGKPPHLSEPAKGSVFSAPELLSPPPPPAQRRDANPGSDSSVGSKRSSADRLRVVRGELTPPERRIVSPRDHHQQEGNASDHEGDEPPAIVPATKTTPATRRRKLDPATPAKGHGDAGPVGDPARVRSRLDGPPQQTLPSITESAEPYSSTCASTTTADALATANSASASSANSVSSVNASNTSNATAKTQAKVNARATAQSVTGAVEPGAKPAIHTRVLLVDDVDSNRVVMRMVLRRIGHPAVGLAGNGQEALAAYESSVRAGEPYTLVLMDLRMPVMDGFKATTEIRSFWAKHKGTAPRPTIMAITADSVDQIRSTCILHGFDGWLNKPIDRDVVAQVMESAIAGKGVPAAASF